MYRKTIDFDKNSFLEVASRITTGGQQLMLALRGPKNNNEISVASALLSESDVRQLINHLEEWLKVDKTNSNLVNNG